MECNICSKKSKFKKKKKYIYCRICTKYICKKCCICKNCAFGRTCNNTKSHHSQRCKNCKVKNCKNCYICDNCIKIKKNELSKDGDIMNFIKNVKNKMKYEHPVLEPLETIHEDLSAEEKEENITSQEEKVSEEKNKDKKKETITTIEENMDKNNKSNKFKFSPIALTKSGLSAVTKIGKTGLSAVETVGKTSINTIAKVGKTSINTVGKVGKTGINTVGKVGKTGISAVETIGKTSISAVSTVGKTGISAVETVGKTSISAVGSVGKTGFTAMETIGNKSKKIVTRKRVNSDGKKYDQSNKWWTYLLKPFNETFKDMKVGTMKVNKILFHDNRNLNLNCVTFVDKSNKFEFDMHRDKDNDSYVMETDDLSFELDTTLSELTVIIVKDNLLLDRNMRIFTIPLQDLKFDLALTSGIYKTEFLTIHYEYKFSKMGDAVSHFVIKNPEPEEEEDFNLGKLYSNAMEFTDLIAPVTNVFNRIDPTLHWQNIIYSFITLVHIIFLTLNPYFMLIYPQVLLLGYVFGNYMIESNKKSPVIEKPIYKMNHALVLLVTKIISITSVESTLQIVQNLIKKLNMSIIDFKDLCQCKNKTNTKNFLIGLSSFTLYLCIFSFRYVTFLVGVFVMLMYTRPVQYTMWFIKGTSSYMSHRKKKKN